MKGIYSKNKFFKKFPKIVQTYFQESKSTIQEDVEYLFDIAENKLKYYEKNKLEFSISMISFDELGLAENSKSDHLKVLYSKLEHSWKDQGVSFIGISNYSFDTTKVSRAFILNIPNLGEIIDYLIQNSYNIVESISKKLKTEKIFEILSKTNFKYKKIVDIIKDLIVYKRYIFFENITQKDSFEKDNNESFKSGSDLNECDNENFSNSDNQKKNKNN